MTRTVKSVLAASAGLMALDMGLASELLAMSYPQDMAAGGGVASAGDAGRYMVERGVAVMPIRGLLTPNSVLLEKWYGWATYRGISEACAELAADESISAVVLEFDTPGGMVLGLEDAALAIRSLAARKPVYALAAPLASSAGYWLASQAREVTMMQGAVVGSIGVAVTAIQAVQPGYDGAQAFDFTSSHARAKWPDPTTEAGKAEIMRALDESEAKFHAAVAAGRGIALADLAAQLSVTDDPADGGATFGAAEAVARGLADVIEGRAEFYARVIGQHAPQGRKPSGRGALALAMAAQAQSEF